MFKKFLVITALFCATHIIQSADNQNPPTDKKQPKSGSLRPRPQSAAASTLQTPPANPPQMLEKHQSGDLSELIASYRKAEGLPPTTAQTPNNPAAKPTDNLPSYEKHKRRAAMSLMLPDASKPSEESQPKKGSLQGRAQSAASASASQPTPPPSTSPNAPGSPLPTMVAEPADTSRLQRPRSSGRKPPITSFWRKDTPSDLSKGSSADDTKQTLAPRKPAGEFTGRTTSQRYALGSRTNLLTPASDSASQQDLPQTPEHLEPAPDSASQQDLPQTPEYQQAVEFYNKSNALLAELQAKKVPLLGCQTYEDLQNIFEEGKEQTPQELLEWMKDFYEKLVEQEKKHREQQAQKDKKANRRETIQRSRSALGLGESRNVLFKSPDSTPTVLSVSPTGEPGEVFCEVFEIPERKKMQEAREKLALLLNEYGTTESTARKNEISREIESIIQLNKKLLITKEISQIIGAVSC